MLDGHFIVFVFWYFHVNRISERFSHLIGHEVCVYLDLSGLVVYLESDFLAELLAEYFRSPNLMKHQFNGAPVGPFSELRFSSPIKQG